MVRNGLGTPYKVKETICREIPEREVRHRLWDVLDKEEYIKILNKNPNLKYCREHYPNGLGTRQFNKLCEMNFGYDERFDVIGYSTDAKGKVLRTWANKYCNYDYVSATGIECNKHGDTVTESVHWPPDIGQPSKMYIGGKREFHWS